MANGWWGDWRPSLPAHTGDLQATDLIECTSIVGGVPVNTAITGQQIIDAAQGGGGSASWGGITGTLSAQTDLQSALNAKQATLVSGTNIKTINSTSLLGSGNIAIPTANPRTIQSVNGTNVNGIINLQSASVFIPAGTISTNNTIYIKAFIERTVASGAGSSVFRFYVNTSNTITGATLLGSGGSMASSTKIQRFERNIFYDGTNLNLFFTGTSSTTDYSASAISLIGFNPAVDNYLLFSVQHSTSLTDVANWRRVIVQAYD